MRLSLCNRFYVVDVLFLDREVGSALLAWCDKTGLKPQDAIQLAVLALTGPEQSEPATPQHDGW